MAIEIIYTFFYIHFLYTFINRVHFMINVVRIRKKLHLTNNALKTESETFAL